MTAPEQLAAAFDLPTFVRAVGDLLEPAQVAAWGHDGRPA